MALHWHDPEDGKDWTVRANPRRSADEGQHQRRKESTRECVASFECGEERYEAIIPVGLGRILAELTDDQMRALLAEAKRKGRRPVDRPRWPTSSGYSIRPDSSLISKTVYRLPLRLWS